MISSRLWQQAAFSDVLFHGMIQTSLASSGHSCQATRIGSQCSRRLFFFFLPHPTDPVPTSCATGSLVIGGLCVTVNHMYVRVRRRTVPTETRRKQQALLGLASPRSGTVTTATMTAANQAGIQGTTNGRGSHFPSPVMLMRTTLAPKAAVSMAGEGSPAPGKP